jgi:hypothetical protein
MIEEQEMVTIERRDLVEMVVALRSSGYRLVQICSTTLAGSYEMNYSFDKDRQFKNLRFAILPGETVPSIRITIENMIPDYHGTLYQVRTPTPFGLKTPSPEESAEGASGTGHETPGEDVNE